MENRRVLPSLYFDDLNKTKISKKKEHAEAGERSGRYKDFGASVSEGLRGRAERAGKPKGHSAHGSEEDKETVRMDRAHGELSNEGDRYRGNPGGSPDKAERFRSKNSGFSERGQDKPNLPKSQDDFDLEKNIDPKHVRVTTPEENKKIEDAIARRKKFDEARGATRAKYITKLKEGAMKRSYTMDEVTVAQLLKGHPMAQEILDELNKGKKRNESGEEFKDGSEDTIGSDGHAAVARPGSIKHEGGFKGKASDNPGVDAKKASVEDGDLEKSDNFTDNEPEEFEDGLVGADGEDDSGDGPEGGDVVVGKSMDESTIEFLIKTMGEEKAEEFLKAVLPKLATPGALRDPKLTEEQKKKSGNPLINRKPNTEALRALQQRLGTGGAEKSEGDGDLEKSEGQPPTYHEIEKKQEDVQSGKAERERKAKARIEANKSQDDIDLEKAKKGTQEEERAEWAKDPEGERKEHRKDKEEGKKSMDWSLDFSKSVLQRMGLEDVEKGSPDVSARKHGGKIRQISYSSKPESRWEHPKAKEHEKTVYHKKTDEIETETKPKEKGAKWTPKGSRVSIGDKEKMEAKFRPKTKSGGDEGADKSEGEFDLHKALDEILEKKTRD